MEQRYYVVVGVCAGVLEHISLYKEEVNAHKQLKVVRESLGIKEGQEEESENWADIIHNVKVQD